jgi:hypothetical protein
LGKEGFDQLQRRRLFLIIEKSAWCLSSDFFRKKV